MKSRTPSNNNIVRERHVIFDEILYYQNEDNLNQSFLLIESCEAQNSVVLGIAAASSASISIELSQYISISSPPPTISSTISTSLTHWPIPLSTIESRQSISSPSVQYTTNQQVVSFHS